MLKSKIFFVSIVGIIGLAILSYNYVKYWYHDIGMYQYKVTQTDTLKQSLSKLNLNNPKKDLMINISKGDYRYIGLRGYSIYCPGLQKEDMLLARKAGIRPIDGTSDMLINNEYAEIMDVAIQYATRYNRELLRMKIK